MPMSAEKPAGDSALRLVASSTINYAVILTLAGCLGSSIWFFAQQSAAMATMNERIVSNKSEINQRITDTDTSINLRVGHTIESIVDRLNVIDKHDESRSTSIGAMDTRLARMEATLGYLASNLAAPAAQGAKK